MSKGAMAVAGLVKAFQYIKDDLTSWYSLKEQVSVRIKGEGINELLGKQEQMHHIGKLGIYNDVSDSSVLLIAYPFEASEQLWNGANIIPNTDYESMLASLFHDLLYGYLEELAKEFKCTESEMRKFADDVLWVIWFCKARSNTERIKAHIGYRVCRWFGGVFKSLSKWFYLVLAVSLFSGCSCFTPPPDWELVEVENGEAVAESFMTQEQIEELFKSESEVQSNGGK